MMSNVLICLLIMAAVGILLCFFGRRFINLSLPLVAFVVVLRYVVEHYGQSEYVLLIALLAGIAGALLARFAKRAAFFIIGFLVGWLLGGLFLQYITLDFAYSTYVVEVICALIVGFLFMRWNNFFISVITAYTGGQRLACLLVFMVVNHAAISSFSQPDILTTLRFLENYFENTLPADYPIYILLLTIIFMLVGISAQNHHGRYHRR